MPATRTPVLVPTPPFYLESGATQMIAIAGVAADTVNGNVVSLATDVIVIFENVNAGAQTVTVTSYPDPNGRIADITNFSIGIGLTVTRRFTRQAWANAAGDLEILAAHADILITPLQV